MKIINFIVVVFLVFLAGVMGCKKDVDGSSSGLTIYQKDNQLLSEKLDLPSSPFDYSRQGVPSFLDVSRIYVHDNTPVDNPITDEGATLGRVLFYDKNLSANQTVSCGSCHIQEYGFSDTATLSVGFEGGLTGRHSMGLSNARFRTNGKFFWDERAATLEIQVLGPIQDVVEMGMDLESLVLAVTSQDYYPILFKRAFGSEEITTDKISKALAQFVRSMTSFNSKFDKGRANHELNEPFDNFTTQENFGKDLFHDLKKGACFSCHFTEAMITEVARNNGLIREPSDIGVENTTGNPWDRGKFKAPSLRNIAVRPPYMHNGEFKTLKSVVEGYSTGITWSPTLDAHLMMPGNTAAVRFNLTDREVDAMVAFLNTLTDEEFLTANRYGDPFK